MARTGINDRPGMADFGSTAPSNYVIVNDISPNSVNSNISNKSFVILFDWNNFIDKIIAKYSENNRTEYVLAIYSILDKLNIKGANIHDFEHILNREINNSVTGFKATIVNNLEGSSCTLDLENFADKWIVQIPGPFYKQSIIQEGIRFTLDAKGRFDTNNFYRIFTGFVTATAETSNPTERRLSLTCKDYARYLARTRYNVHPGVHETELIAKQGAPTVWTSNLQGKGGAEIIGKLLSFSLAHQADKIALEVPETWERVELIDPSSVKSTGRYIEETTKDPKTGADVKKTKLVKGSVGKLGIPSNKDGVIEDRYRFNFHHKYDPKLIKTYKYDDNYQPKILIWGHTGEVYTEMFGSFNLYFSEFKTKKDIILDVAALTHYVAYIDGAGNFHYHPPRFEEDSYLTIKNGEDYAADTTEDEPVYTYWLTDDEIISSSYTQNEEEVCTVARGHAQGAFGIFQQVREKVDPSKYQATIVWVDGVNRFGFRERTFSTAAFTDFSEGRLAVFTAANLLRANQERIQMSATIPMRPELQVDRPIYDYTKKKYYHIRSVTHSYNAGGANSGGDWTTSIIAYAGRSADEKISSNIFSKSYKYNSVQAMLDDKFTTLTLDDLETANKEYATVGAGKKVKQ